MAWTIIARFVVIIARFVVAWAIIARFVVAWARVLIASCIAECNHVLV